MQTPDDISDLLCELTAEDAPLIIYANTVERAQAYRKWFADSEFDEENIVLYHSRFCEPDKAAIEKKLEKLMGRKAWESDSAKGIAILTQIGELSVNISADNMISDLCPIDRLTQRAGRLSRFEKRGDGRKNVVGDLHVVLPIRNGEEVADEWYPAPYGRFAGGKWELTDVLRQSNQWLPEGEYSPRDFSELVSRLYPTSETPTARARENARKLENSFVNNWLIVQNAELESVDDEQTHDWKSRDIAPQQTVFVGVKVDNFLAGESSTELIKNRMDFRKWQLKHGVQIYAYQLEMAQRIGAIEKHQIIVGEDSEEVWLVNDDYYDLKYGLRLQREVENYDDFE